MQKKLEFAMEVVINERIDPKILMEFERKYQQEEAMGNISDTTKFEYAWCLVRSHYSDDWKTGCRYLEELYEKGDDHARRDYLYYMAVAQLKLKNYNAALSYCDIILQVQPENRQVRELRVYVQKQLRKEGLIGMAAVGGAGLLVGAAATAAAAAIIALTRRR